MSTRLRWLVAFVAVAGLAVYATIGNLLWQAHTARQPQVTAAVPYMDAAIGRVVTSAGDGSAVAVGAIVESRVCQLDALTQGGEFTRTADLFTDPGHEDALINQLAARLKANYDLQPLEPIGGFAAWHADVGHGVQLTISRLGEGWVVATARTTCTRPTASQPLTVSDSGATTVAAILSTLGTTAARSRTDSIACPDGGNVVTVTEASEPTRTDHLFERLTSHIPAGSHVYQASVNRVAYRDGHESVIVRASDDGTAITVRYTTSC